MRPFDDIFPIAWARPLGPPFWKASRSACWSSAVEYSRIVISTLTIWPSWPVSWFATVSSAPHITPPVLLPWGWLLLTPLTFCKYPPARFLVLLACLPQSPLFYEAVLLFVVVRTWGEAVWLWLTTLLVWLLMPIQVADPSNVYEVLPAGAPKMLWGAYLPGLTIVIRQGWQERKWAVPRLLRDASRVNRLFSR